MIKLDALQSATPSAQQIYWQAFEGHYLQLRPYGILDSPLRSRHFLAQVLHETGGLRVLLENLNYSAERLCVVWPSRFPTLASALPFAHNPRALANKVYGGRMGNVEPNDGWRYIGRGLLQLTGRASYTKVGDALGIDLVGSPSMALYPEHALSVAGEIWKDARCNVFADMDSIEKVTRAINGGLIGLEERRAWFARTQRMVI